MDILPAEVGQRSKARDWLAVLVLFPPPPLPACVRLCYKPDMRKWMRDRLKRRQKTPESGTGEPAPAPLQPAYFDAEVPPASAQAREAQTESAAEPPASGRGEDAPEAVTMRPVQAPSDGGNGNARRRRRRRGRGGRGRGGPQTVGSAAQVEAARPSAGESSEATAPAKVPAGVKAAAPAPRAPKGSVILAIGLPGSGKSSWFKRHNITPLSSDLLRALLFDDPTEQRFQDLVFSNLRSMLKARLIARRPLNYVDATNLTPHERQSWIKLAHDYAYEVQAVFFDVPLEVCLERNQRRQRVVGDDVMRRMSVKLRPPTFDEGFSKITVVRVKRKE